MTESKICTCPSGDGSLRWPCPAHPEQQADVAAKLTFINGRPAMCGCQVEYSDGGGEYSDVIYVTLCAKHSGSAILDLVATNRIALTPEYEGQWHADLYLDREIPLAKVEGATPAEAVLALMSAERIDPEQESVEQAGGDRWDALQSIMEWTAAENIPDDRKLCLIRNAARAALAQPSPAQPEQAEAERPEVVAYRTIGRHTKHQHPHYALNYYKQNAEDQAAHWRERGCEVSEDELMTVAQHERIVGALRAENAKLSEALDRWPLIRDSLKLRLADALARVAELEGKLTDWVHEGFRLNEALAVAKAQHSVPEGLALIPVRETEAMHDAVMALLYKGVARTDTQKLLDAYIAAAPGKEGV
ncbi:hypothetical protein ACEOPL_26560 [Pseudomonas aeruginosa]